MNLNDSQRMELGKILSSDLFKAAEAIVLFMTDRSVDELPMDQAVIRMSNEKGVRNAFRLLRKVASPEFNPIPPLTRKSLHSNGH